MIALPGLTLQTGRPEIARSILQTFAEYVDGGMLPNRFPDGASEPEYNTVDATFWFVEAIRAYVAWTGDRKLLRGLFPVLEQIVDSHLEGTRYNIHVDPEDRLVYAGEAGVQLTWMDAKVGDRVVTPRIGKPVEINALWYHALKCMAKFAALLDKKSDRYDALASQVKQSFKRFWNKEAGYCYDVLDGPDGDDLSLRPNQLFAVSLVHSALSKSKRKHVVDVCSRHLLTPYGMRTLAPAEAGYQGRYGGSREQRDGAYHQGTSWAWLIGAFISAHYAVYKDARAARFFLRPLLSNLNMDCVGSVSEIFDGDPPYAPRGAFAQAWSVAEILRVWGTAV